MPSPSPASRGLPLFHALAEGGWLAVVYAAAQAALGGTPQLGPIELAILAGIGMAWGRRTGWRSAGAEAFGLPVLALLGGTLTWLLDPQVRFALANDGLLAAIGTHAPGFMGAIAVWRGEVHHTRDDDELLAEQRLRWVVPGLAIPWLLGYLASSGEVEVAFTATAFFGTLLFVGSGFAAMGVAHLEAMRVATGSEWRHSRSWLALVLGIALAMTVVGIPAALLLQVPASAALAIVIGPLVAIYLLFVLLTIPLILGAAVVSEALGPMLPANFDLPLLELPDLGVTADEVVSDLPAILFYVIVGLLALLELAVVALMIWLRWNAKRTMQLDQAAGFEEREIVVPAANPRPPRPPEAARRIPPDAAHPIGAYLTALDLLARDGRWPRRPDETPAVHADRVQRAMAGSAFGRLAATYQLARYGERTIGRREAARGPSRLAALRSSLTTPH